MAETERTRERERGTIPQTPYEIFIRSRKEFLERQDTGQVVVKPSDREFFLTRQGVPDPSEWPRRGEAPRPFALAVQKPPRILGLRKEREREEREDRRRGAPNPGQCSRAWPRQDGHPQ